MKAVALSRDDGCEQVVLLVTFIVLVWLFKF